MPGMGCNDFRYFTTIKWLVIGRSPDVTYYFGAAEGSEGEANETATDNPRIQDNEERERIVNDERRNVEGKKIHVYVCVFAIYFGK